MKFNLRPKSPKLDANAQKIKRLEKTLRDFISQRVAPKIERGAIVRMKDRDSVWNIAKGEIGRVRYLSVLDSARVRWQLHRPEWGWPYDESVTELDQIEPYNPAIHEDNYANASADQLVSIAVHFGKLPASVRKHFGLSDNATSLSKMRSK